MRLLDTETDHESERDLRHMQNNFSLSDTRTRTHAHSLCSVSIDYVGSIMRGAGAVKERTVSWHRAVSQREYTSVGERTHKHSITTPLFCSIHHLSHHLSSNTKTDTDSDKCLHNV